MVRTRSAASDKNVDSVTITTTKRKIVSKSKPSNTKVKKNAQPEKLISIIEVENDIVDGCANSKEVINTPQNGNINEKKLSVTNEIAKKTKSVPRAALSSKKSTPNTSLPPDAIVASPCVLAENDCWQPNGWKVVLENIRAMRSKEDAPVDTMGCERCVHPTATPKEKRYQILVSLLLSSQTKDEVTYAACERLRKLTLTPENMAQMDEETIRNTIYPVGYYKKKATYLKAMSRILVEKFDSDIPRSIEELCALPGIGPKMAYLAMSCAWLQAVGIGVDTHVHRIANRLKWLPKPTKTPEETRKQLEQWLPREHWSEINWLLVGFGQTICLPTNPKCGECLNKTICPSVDKRLTF